MRCYQWKNRKLLIPFPLLIKVCGSKRASKTLAKLLLLFDTSPIIKTTFDKLATYLGYENRSGAYKAIRLLERLGVVAYKDGYLQLTMGEVLLRGFDE